MKAFALLRQPYITEPDPILWYRILPDARHLELPIPHHCVLRIRFRGSI